MHEIRHVCILRPPFFARNLIIRSLSSTVVKDDLGVAFSGLVLVGSSYGSSDAA